MIAATLAPVAAAALLVGFLAGRWWSWRDLRDLRVRVDILESLRDTYVDRTREYHERVLELEAELEALEGTR